MACRYNIKTFIALYKKETSEKQEAPRAREGIRSLASTGDDGTVRGSDASPVIIVLSFLCIVLLTVFVSIFGRKFYKAWSHGAHGRQLFWESFRVN